MMVDLSDSTMLFGLVVPYATGVTYTNVVGGSARYRAELEGFFIPLHPPVRRRDPLLGECALPGSSGFQGITEERAEWYRTAIKQTLSTMHVLGWLQPPSLKAIKRVGVAEAWVPVRVQRGCSATALKHVWGRDAILTYMNIG